MTEITDLNGSPALAAYSYRADPGVPRFADDRAIVVYDGNCRLCSGLVQFVLRHDRHDRFRFIAAQSALGTALYRHYGLAATHYDTYIVLDDGYPWLRSEGSLRLAARLGFPWSLLALGRLLPRALRDRAYDWLARNRLRWFGARETCYLLEPSQEHKFLG